MRLFDWLDKEWQGEYPWEDYAYSDVDIPQLETDIFLLCGVWDRVIRWAEEHSDTCRGIDAALIIRVVNATLSIIEKRKQKITESTPTEETLVATEDICSLYARACLFARSPWSGTEYYEKCCLIVNNLISECVIRTKKPAVFADLETCDPDRDVWEEI